MDAPFISDTAEYGDLTRGERIITNATRDAMRGLLKDIQTESSHANGYLRIKLAAPYLTHSRDERGSIQ